MLLRYTEPFRQVLLQGFFITITRRKMSLVTLHIESLIEADLAPERYQSQPVLAPLDHIDISRSSKIISTPASAQSSSVLPDGAPLTPTAP